MAGYIPKPLLCHSDHTHHSALHMHTHILLNMIKPLQRLISDFIFSSSPGLARLLPSIIYAFALMNY